MLPFIERWRPKDFDEVIGVPDIEILKGLIASPMDMPNMLFYGPQGTGKTTCAKIIVEKLKPSNWMKSLVSKIREQGGVGGVAKKAVGGIGKLLSVGGPIMLLVGMFTKMKPIQELIAKFMEKIKPLFEKIAAKILPVISKVLEALMPIFDTLVSKLLMPLIEKLLPPLLIVLGFLLKAIGSLISGIGQVLKVITVGTVGQGMIDLGRDIKSAGGEMISAARQMQRDTERRETLENELASLDKILTSIDETVSLERIEQGKLETDEMGKLRDAVIKNSEAIKSSMGTAAETDMLGMLDDLVSASESAMHQAERLKDAGVLGKWEVRQAAFETLMNTDAYKRLVEKGVAVTAEEMWVNAGGSKKAEDLYKELNSAIAKFTITANVGGEMISETRQGTLRRGQTFGGLEEQLKGEYGDAVSDISLIRDINSVQKAIEDMKKEMGGGDINKDSTDAEVLTEIQRLKNRKTELLAQLEAFNVIGGGAGPDGAGGTTSPSGPAAAIFRANADGTITKVQDAREAELENVEATKNATEETAGNTGAVLTEAEKQTKELQALNIGIYGLINTMRAKEGMAPMERPVY